LRSLTETLIDFAACIDVIVLGLVYLGFLLTQTIFLARHHPDASVATPCDEQDWPLISVLVPAYNEAGVIEATISSILAADYPHMQLIVIDDGSEDRTVEIVAQLTRLDPRITLIRQPRNWGKANALNAGIASARADLLVIVDADTIPEPDFFKQVVRPILQGQADAVAGNVKVGSARYRKLSIIFQNIEYISVLSTTRLIQGLSGSITTIAGAAGAMRRTAVHAIGGYSSRTRAEDAELTLRLTDGGFRIAYQPRAIVRTEAPSTWHALYHQRVRWMQGNMQCINQVARCPDHGSPWRPHGRPLFVYENVWKPPLEFCRAVLPLLAFGSTLRLQLLCAYGGLLLVHWLGVALSFRIEEEDPRDLLHVPLQYALWPLFLIVPYCAAAWHFVFNNRVAWRKAARNGVLTSIAFPPNNISATASPEPADEPAKETS
jgi:glycosyltransferase involved in cell wall biosynthesis